MSTDEIANLPDVSEGLEFAIKSAAHSCNTVDELLSIINTKRYTKTRLQRILLYAILGITKKDMQISMNTKPYIRVLGFNDKGRELISEISKHNRKLEIVSSVKKLYLEGSNKLAENSDALRDGVKQLSDGAKQLADNSQALRDGAAQLKDAAPALIDGIGQLVDGAKKVNGFTPIH